MTKVSNELSGLHGAGGAALVIALTEAIKRAFPAVRDGSTALIALGIGICLSVLLAVADQEPVLPHILTGLGTVALACGLYSVTKASVASVQKSHSEHERVRRRLDEIGRRQRPTAPSSRLDDD